MTTADTIRKQAQAVLEARTEAARAKEALDQARRKWEEENADLITDARYYASMQADAENKLRELALQAFEELHSKTPGPGVAIRIIAKAYYETEGAFRWAKEHGMFLALDTKAFEKFAKEYPSHIPEVVTIGYEPQAVIATDLAKALAS